MIVLPTLILLFSAIVLRIFRKGHIRIQWFIELIGIGIVWISTYLFASQIPTVLEFFLWKPDDLFPTTFLLRIDGISWPLSMGIVSVLFTILLTRPSREEIYDYREYAGILIFTGMTVLAVIAGNILSIVSVWMVMDVFIIALYLRTGDHVQDDSSVLLWSTKNLTSIFLMILAFVLNVSQMGEAPLVSGAISSPVILLIIASSLLRMPFLSIARNAEQIGWLDPGSKAILDLFPAITGIGVLGQLFNAGITAESQEIIRILGTTTLILSVLYIVFIRNFKISALGFFLGFVGMSLIAETYLVIQPGFLIVAAGTLCLLLVSTTEYFRLYEKWNLFFPVLVAAIVIGLPASPGMLLGRSIVELSLSARAFGFGLLIVIALISLEIIFLRSVLFRKDEWISSDKLTRMSYSSGLIVLSLSGMLIGIRMQTGTTLTDILFFSVMMIIVGAIYLVSNKLRVEIPVFHFVYTSFFQKTVENLNGVGRFLMAIIRGTGNIFESETGVLWAFVILQLLVLALVDLG